MLNLSLIETSMAFMHVEDDILYITLKEDADLKVENIDEMIDARIRIQNGKKMKVIADIRNIWQASLKARKRAASSEMQSQNIAMAIVTDSLASKLLANFFIKINKPSSPTRMFNSKEEGLLWLNTIGV
ncbi:MAG: STAS/SEC14 domain-containing protein [Flavobacteriales bacterium]|nr:STAS/SEC14 domain-containing protein [Flavobacteriales bacterium]MCB9334867.1 STAS/SEC14 domain-containing protein [Flavobacteriales bacterium]